MGKSISNIDSKTLIRSILFIVVFWSVTIALFCLAYHVTQNLNLSQVITNLFKSI